jgi:hypothetical protein
MAAEPASVIAARQLAEEARSRRNASRDRHVRRLTMSMPRTLSLPAPEGSRLQAPEED